MPHSRNMSFMSWWGFITLKCQTLFQTFLGKIHENLSHIFLYLKIRYTDHNDFHDDSNSLNTKINGILTSDFSANGILSLETLEKTAQLPSYSAMGLSL